MTASPDISPPESEDRSFRPAVRHIPFGGAMASFAEMVGPRRRMLRDPYYSVAQQRDEAPIEPASLGRGTWVMTVVAGVVLGVAVTFMLAGT